MVNEDPLPLKYYLTYRNIETNEEQDYLSPDYPYNDSVWLSQWEFVKQRVIDPNPRLHDMRIEDEDGNDFTADFIENPDYQFLFIAYDISRTSLKNIDITRNFINKSFESGLSFIAITGSLPEDVYNYKQNNNLDLDFYYSDDVPLMTMIRSNPGLILMKEGVVLEKWHYNDFPEFADIREKYSE